MSEGVRCMWMRGGTSKGGYFLKSDLPADTVDRDAFLLRVMGSPDSRQIDGMGGANPLMSKVAVVSKSDREDADVNYLFLQVFTDQAIVSDAQNCGNILAGVAPFVIERGLVPAKDGQTEVRIFMENTGQIAVATVETPNGHVTYDGAGRIDGVPGTAAPIEVRFKDTAGSSCGALLPTGNAVDLIDGHHVTLIDDGMPCVILTASEFGVSGSETPAVLDADIALKARIEAIRLKAGVLMNLGDVTKKSVPKMVLVSRATHGTINTRSFIPHTCHDAIGVLGAVSVGTACLLPNGPAAALARLPKGNPVTLEIEHPTGSFGIIVSRQSDGRTEAAVLRTARKLMDGMAFG